MELRGRGIMFFAPLWKLQLKFTGLFKYVWPFSGDQALKSELFQDLHNIMCYDF